MSILLRELTFDTLKQITNTSDLNVRWIIIRVWQYYVDECGLVSKIAMVQASL